MRTRAAAHSSIQSPRSLARQFSNLQPYPLCILSPQPLYILSESLFELGRRFLDLKCTSSRYSIIVPTFIN